MKDLVLVTGASGFVGTQLCASLREAGYKFRTLTHRNSLADKDSFRMDLLRDPCPEGIFTNVDTVFHLAGMVHNMTESDKEKLDYVQTNVEGTRKLLEAAQQAGVKRFIFLSSVKAVGEADKQPMDETLDVPADTPYGQSKYAAEQLVLHGHYVPHPVVIRPCMVYGNSDKGNLPRMVKAIKRGFFPPLPEFQNRRSMVHVQDVVRAAILAAEKPQAAGQIYIVTDGHYYSTRQIYDWVREGLGKTPVKWEIPRTLLEGIAKLGDAIGRLIGRRFLFDSTALQKLSGSAWYASAKIERELGFKPQYTLPQSLPDIIRFLNSK